MDTAVATEIAPSLLIVACDPVTLTSVEATVGEKFPAMVVHRAADCGFGLVQFREHAPPIVLADLDLIAAGGGQLPRDMLAANPQVRLIALASVRTPGVSHPATAGPPYDHLLHKPIDPELLAEAIGCCLARLELEKLVEGQRASIRKLSRIVEQSPATIVITDTSGSIEYVNPKFTQLTGFTPGEAIGQNPRLLKSGMTSAAVYRELWDTISRGGIWRGEFLNRKKDGELYWESASISPMLDDEGHTTHYIAMKEDITRYKLVEQELQKSEWRYHSLFEHMLNGFAYCRIVLDDLGFPADFIYLDVNSAFAKLIEIADVVGKRATEVFPGIREAHPELFEIYGRVALTGVPERFDFEFMPFGRWLSISVYSPEREHFVAVFDDITERRRAVQELSESEERYKALSITDSLTRLHNSRHFFDRILDEIARANRYDTPLSLILLDIDNFKGYNDTYGHMEGDKVLACLADSMREGLRQIDSAYRYGGEEFTVLLPETESAKALIVAERIRKSFEAKRLSPLPDVQVGMTISLGVGQYRPDEQKTAFLKRVDTAMYRAKELGKNRVCLAL